MEKNPQQIIDENIKFIDGINSSISELNKEKSQYEDELQKICCKFTEYFINTVDSGIKQPTLDQLNYWLQYLKYYNLNDSIDFFAGTKNKINSYQFNIQYLMAFLKNLYEYETKEEYRIQTSFGFIPSCLLGWLDYTLVPESLYPNNGSEYLFNNIDFNKTDAKMISFRHYADYIYNSEFKPSFFKKEARRDLSHFFVTMPKANGEQNTYSFPVYTNIHKEDLTHADRLTDLFTFNVNHDDEFLIEALFRLIRKQNLSHYGVEASYYENLYRMFTNKKISIRNEVINQFQGYSHIRTDKKSRY